MNVYKTREKIGRGHFATGRFPLSWPMYDGVPAQPTHRRHLDGVKPFPGMRAIAYNGMARTFGCASEDDESLLDSASELYSQMQASPEDTMIAALDNGTELGHFPHRKWNCVERPEPAEYTPDPYDAVFEAKLREMIMRSYACSRVPEQDMIRLKALRAAAQTQAA